MKREQRSGSIVAPLGTFCDLQPVHMRDLRKLYSPFAAGSHEPSIVVRKQAILINAGEEQTNECHSCHLNYR